MGDGIDGKRRLVAQGDEGGVERAGKLPQGGDAGAQGRGHALGPRGIVDDQHREPGEDRADFFRMGAEHDDDRPGGRGERGLDGADKEGFPVEQQELFRRAHPGGLAGGQDYGAETKFVA